MNRRKFLIGAVATCAALLSSVLTLSSATAGDKVRLTMHTFYGTELDPVTKQFAKNVKEWSNGSLRVRVFRGGELVGADQLLSAVTKGTVDMAHGMGAYWGGQLDMGNLESGMPGAWTSAEEHKDIFDNQGFSNLLREAYAEKGVHYITNGMGGRYDLLTSKPINSLDDLKSMKIRASGQMSSVLKKLDIPSVFLPGQELYVAMSTGVINGAIYGGPYDYHSFKLHETAKYYTTLNVLSPGWNETYLANQKKWDSLSQSHQEILTRASKQMAKDVYEFYAKNDQLVLDQNIFEISELSPQDSSRLTAAAQQVWDDESARSERNTKAVAILRASAKKQGRL